VVELVAVVVVVVLLLLCEGVCLMEDGVELWRMDDGGWMDGGAQVRSFVPKYGRWVMGVAKRCVTPIDLWINR
jgi:hypothetical protein